MRRPSVFPLNVPVLPVLWGSFLLAFTSATALGDEPKLDGSVESRGDESGHGILLKPVGTDHSFDFETEQMQGTIRLDGAYHGVTRLVDKRTGLQVIDPRYSALNLFRLMSVNRLMGVPRHMERTIATDPDSVQVTWPATETHAGEISARYEVVAQNAIDVTVTVKSQGTYAGYEVFVSSYFEKGLRPHVHLQALRGETRSLVVPTLNDVFRGTLLVFPRDAHAARRGLDGRWDPHTIQLCPVRHYLHCIAYLADPDNRLAVVLMSRPRDCYAISTRYYAEDDADRLTDYSAFDLSLFGSDLLPGDEQTATVRLVLTAPGDDQSRPLELYRAFLTETDPARNPSDEQNPKGGAQ
jgi:hypothetical protein